MSVICGVYITAYRVYKGIKSEGEYTGCTPDSFSIEYKAFRWAGIALRTPGRLKNSSFSGRHLLHCYNIVDYLYRIVNDGKIKFQLLHSSDNIMVYHLF